MPSIALPVSLRGQLLSGTRTFSPSSLFAAGEPGVWYDPSDTATLFQDPAGTTPVTAPSQTVALMLDKSRGLALGTELITNAADRDFSSDTGFWTKSSGEISISGGVCAFAAAADSRGIERNFFLVTGKYYEITFTVVTRTSGGFQAYVGGPLGAIYTAPGTYTQRIVCGANSYFGIVARGTTTGSIDNISVRELAGNHATQATTAARPTYSIEPVGGRRNLLTFSEDLSNAIWLKPAGTTTVMANTAMAPDGTVTADLVTATAGSTCHYVFQNVSTSGSVTCTVYAKAGTANWLGLSSGYTNGGETAWFDLTNGTVGTVAAGGTASIVSAGNGWWRCSHTRSSWTGGGAMTFVTNANGVAVFNAVGTENLLIWGAQLETGPTATNYQRVTTQHDVTEAGVASVSYLYFDGGDDGMITSTITPGTDKMQAFAGVRKLLEFTTESDGQTILETSADAAVNNGAFILNGSVGYSTGRRFAFQTKASGSIEAASSTSATFNAPVSAVVAGLGDISGDTRTLRLNGTQVAQNTVDQGTGNFLAYPLNIGRRTNGLFRFNGHIYSLVVRFGPNLDAPTIASTEAYVAGKTGFPNWANIVSPTIFARDNTAVLDRFNQIIERRAV